MIFYFLFVCLFDTSLINMKTTYLIFYEKKAFFMKIKRFVAFVINNKGVCTLMAAKNKV